MCKARRSGSRESSRESSREYRRGRLAQPATEKHNAASEDRTHDLRIMRPTRYHAPNNATASTAARDTGLCAHTGVGAGHARARMPPCGE